MKRYKSNSHLLGLFTIVACSTPSPNIDSASLAACNCDADPQPCCCTTPVVLDLAGDGIKLTTWQDGVTFNLDPQKGPEPRAWTEVEPMMLGSPWTPTTTVR